MSLFSRIVTSRVMQYMASETRLLRQRRLAEKKRQSRGAPHRIEYFHQADDPYSHLMLQVLPIFKNKYAVDVKVNLVNSPPDWAAPERKKLNQFSLRDAQSLAQKAGLSFPASIAIPDKAQTHAVVNQLVSKTNDDAFFEQALELSNGLWRTTQTDDAQALSAQAQAALDAGDRKRDKLGHYLGATLYYAGEWYWGVDRLAFLEERLSDLNIQRDKSDTSVIYSQPDVPAKSLGETPKAELAKPELHFFLSFRSPYTYIAIPRVRALAKAYGAELKLRFVLPMVMRGLPVPMAKKKYIFLDVAREARRLGIPYGRLVDPVGKPVERGYSLLPWAINSGRGAEYCWAYMQGVSAKGWDAGSDSGMKKIVEAAGLDWSLGRELLGNQDWRTRAEVNQQELLDLNLWGVPSFRVNNVSVWGQDRLWLIEDELKRLSQLTATPQ